MTQIGRACDAVLLLDLPSELLIHRDSDALLQLCARPQRPGLMTRCHTVRLHQPFCVPRCSAAHQRQYLWHKTSVAVVLEGGFLTSWCTSPGAECSLLSCRRHALP